MVAAGVAVFRKRDSFDFFPGSILECLVTRVYVAMSRSVDCGGKC